MKRIDRKNLVTKLMFNIDDYADFFNNSHTIYYDIANNCQLKIWWLLAPGISIIGTANKSYQHSTNEKN